MADPQPRYLDIASHVRDLVARAEPGDLLPSDADLCMTFGVSRMTARQAVQILVNEHLVERRRGQGTFVAPRRVPRALGSPLSFTEAMRKRGLKASSEPISLSPATASATEAESLNLPPGSRVHVIERLRLADDVPMAIERAALPPATAMRIDPFDPARSLHDAFEDVGLIPSMANAEVGARLATEWEQEMLDIGTESVVLTEERTIFDQRDNPLEHTLTLYAADRHSFTALLLPDQSP